MARKAHDVTNAEETYLLRHSMELSPLRMQKTAGAADARKVNGVCAS